MKSKFIPFSKPLFGPEEKKEVLKTLDLGWVTSGPKTRQFEEEFQNFIGVKYSVAVSSATAGLHISLLALGIGQDDEVITTPFTFAATANVIVQVGAKPVFVDIKPNTFNIDPEKIEKAVTSKTKAIIPVHYAGQPCEMDEITRIAKKHKLKTIEDAAHALGASYKGRKIGTIGNATCFSFHAIKNISTGDGGMITTNDLEFAELAKIYRFHGVTDKVGWKYDVTLPGFKYNMTDIEASLGLWQLKKLNKFLKIREDYAQIYDQSLSQIPEITIPYIKRNVRHVRNLYTVLLNLEKLKIDRDKLVEELKKENIETWVYFTPIHFFSFYKKKFGFKKGDFPVIEEVFKKIICLPIYPKMESQDVRSVIKILTKIISKNRK